ncbi:hypothetical protein BDV93DRAFT_289107 [Ceratobasidium sp. AG-I]|nr:hypothetical protein BDV93DRAFT_289107 [Ceratobasidium sp. AG-I]
MAACISHRPFTAETPAFDRSWADITPAGTVVRAADVATRSHQPYPSYSSSASSTLADSDPSARLNDRTSWFSAKTAVWDPRILLNAVKGQDAEYTLHKAVEWGTKCNSDLSDEDKVDNVLRFLAHAVGLQSAINMDASGPQSTNSTQSSHSRGCSTWSSISECSIPASPQSDVASLLDFRCDTPVMGSRPSPSPSIRSYCIAEPEDDEHDGSCPDNDLRLLSAQSSIPDITSLPNSICSESVERESAMEELREIVRNAVVAAEEDDAGPPGFAKLHAAVRDMSYARQASVKAVTPPPPPTQNEPKTPPLNVDAHLKHAGVDSPIWTPLVRPCGFSPQSSMTPEHFLGTHSPQPMTPRSKSNKLQKPRPVSPNDPIPLQTFRTISSPSPPPPPSPPTLVLDTCRSRTPRMPESPTWSHGLLKNPFGLRLDVHMLTDAMTGLGIRKPASPPHARDPSPLPLRTPDLGELPSPLDSPIEDCSPCGSPTERHQATRCDSGTSDWQYLRHRSGDTEERDTPVLATPIDEWYVPQFTPATEYGEWRDAGVGERGVSSS